MNDETPIAMLFARDPLKHTDQDIDRIIAKMREARSQFNTDAKKPAASKQTEKEKAVANIKLDLDGL